MAPWDISISGCKDLTLDKGHKPYGKLSGRQLGLRMGRESCEELSLGAIWKEKWGYWATQEVALKHP